jgi:hypothetical protein
LQITGLVLIGISIGIWGYMWMRAYVYQPLPDTITDEEKVKAQIERSVLSFFVIFVDFCYHSKKQF